MTLKNHIKKILREESLSESIYLRRRFDKEKLDYEFEESMEYALRARYKFESLKDLKHYVISVMMDGLHGELSNWGSIDFPYDEIYNFLKNEYSDEIEEYNHLIGDNKLNESKGWVDLNKKLERTFKFKYFNGAIDFVNKVAKIAESQNHHPNIEIKYNKVKISITDHEKGGVSEKCHKFIKEVNNIK